MNPRELAVFLCVAAGLFALGLLGAPLAPLALAAAPVCALAPLLRGHVVPDALVVGTAVVGAVAGAAFGAEHAAGIALVALQVGQRLAGRDRASLVLAVLMLVLVGTRATTPLFLAPFAVFAASLPVALLRVGEARVGARGGPLAAVALAVAALLFPALPRVRAEVVLPAHATPVTLTGFGREVALGDVGVLLDDDAPVLRVSGPVGGPLYLRGVALDRFDGRRWASTGATGVAPWGEGGQRFEILLEDADEGVLFAPGTVVGVEGVVAAWDVDGNGYAPATPGRLAYAVTSLPPFAPGQSGPPTRLREEARFLQLPADLDPQVRAMADRITAGVADPAERVERIAAELADYGYTRTPRDLAAEDPLAVFLFERRSGHCEYFASALAVLARASGVPSRVVNGFAGGEYNAVGDYHLFRRAHAHAWVEVWLGDRWLLVDATPGPGAPAGAPSAGWALRDALETLWYGRILTLDRGRQTAPVLSAGRAIEGCERGFPWFGLVALGALAALLAAIAWAVGRRAGRRLAGEPPVEPRGRVARAHARIRRRLVRMGWQVPPSLPPVAAARWVREQVGDEAEPLEALAWLHYQVRYGGADDAASARRASALEKEAERIGPPP